MLITHIALTIVNVLVLCCIWYYVNQFSLYLKKAMLFLEEENKLADFWKKMQSEREEEADV